MGRGRKGFHRGNQRNHGPRKKPFHKPAGGAGNKKRFNQEDGNFEDKTDDNKRQKLDDINAPVEDEETSSSESEEEEVKPYVQLLSMFKSSSRAQQVVTSDEEETDSSDEEQDDNLVEENIEDCDDEDEEEEDLGEEEEGEVDEEGEEDIKDEENILEDEIEEDSEEEPEDAEEDVASSSDTFELHFNRELTESLLGSLTSPKPYESHELKWKALGRMVVQLPSKAENVVEKPKPILGESIESFVTPGTLPVLKTEIPLKDYGVKLQLCENLDKRPLADKNQFAEDILTPLQHELFTLANEYRDIYYPEMTLANSEEIRTVYCLHALNHVLKSRDKVLVHNAKLKKASANGGLAGDVEYRDQGLVRPRVLIIAPVRNSAVK